MRTSNKTLLALVCVGGLAAWSHFEYQSIPVATAADHTEAPGSSADSPADIADVYSWHNAQDNTLTVVMTYAGPQAPAAEQSAAYDADTLYGIHIDNTGDNIANHNIWFRFGENSLGEWGIQVVGAPGSTGPIVGAVNTSIVQENISVHAGLFDDPFFFDLQGFSETVSTGALSFDSTRDSLKGQNISAIVIEMPLSAAKGATDAFGVWATTGRI